MFEQAQIMPCRKDGQDFWDGLLVGEKDQALRWLDHAIDYGICNVSYLKEHDPFLIGLREDPDFDDLMSKAEDVSKSIIERLETEDRH